MQNYRKAKLKKKKKKKKKKKTFPTKKITDTEYAEDLALLSDNSNNVQKNSYNCIFQNNQQLLLDYMLMEPKRNICATIRTIQ